MSIFDKLGKLSDRVGLTTNTDEAADGEPAKAASIAVSTAPLMSGGPTTIDPQALAIFEEVVAAPADRPFARFSSIYKLLGEDETDPQKLMKLSAKMARSQKITLDSVVADLEAGLLALDGRKSELLVGADKALDQEVNGKNGQIASFTQQIEAAKAKITAEQQRIAQMEKQQKELASAIEASRVEIENAKRRAITAHGVVASQLQNMRAAIQQYLKTATK